MRQYTRVSGVAKEMFRPAEDSNSSPVMGQRNLTVWRAVVSREAKRSFIEKGLMINGGGAFFLWVVEHGRLAKTEISCAVARQTPYRFRRKRWSFSCT